MIILSSKNVRHLHKYYHTALGTALKTKLLLNVKGQNRGFWKTSNLGLCPSSVALNKSLKNKWNFGNTKIFKNFKFHRVWTELEMKMFSLTTMYKISCLKNCRQIHKIKQNRFFFGMFPMRFSQFIAQLPKLALGWPTGSCHQFKTLQGFSNSFQKILSCKSFDTSWGHLKFVFWW